jgi:hypothetical protein
VRGLAELGKKWRLKPGRAGKIAKPVDPFAGEQDQIIEGSGDEAAQPVYYRRGIGRAGNRHRGAGDDFGTLLAQHRREPVRLAGFE